MTGVPAFIGFTDQDPSVCERGGALPVVLDRWDVDTFNQSVKPAKDSFLHMAVRGFFANGGKRCVVLPVSRKPAEGQQDSARSLLDVLGRGGPLDERTDIDLICIPDAVSALHGDRDPYQIHAAALAHCERMGDRFAILDAPDIRPPTTQDIVNELLGTALLPRSAFGALYFPWIASDRARDALKSAGPAAGSQEWRWLPRRQGDSAHRSLEFGPPCGHIAGLIARLDDLVGPQRAPANANLDDVIDTTFHLSDSQHALLNEGGVNCLRSVRGGGVDVGGARTLSGHPVWAFISTARVILGFRRWLEVGMRDLVFEPQTTLLWDRIRLRLIARCSELLTAGALAGSDPAGAFFVKCDSETNPPDEIDVGVVVAHVGLAPSVPAEFIVIRVEHDPSGVTVSSLSE
jgi:phage tail sheath protein FI